MLLRNAAVLALVLGSLSCSTGTGGQNGQSISPEYAIMQSPGSVIQTTIDGSRISGPSIMLERTDDRIRGTGPSGVVDLRKDDGGNTWRGIIGTGPTELHLEPLDEGGFVLRGMFNGALGRLEIRTDRIEGQIGRCQYNLRPHPTDKGVAYNGRRVCGGTPFEPAAMTLPPTVMELEPIDRAAIIAILLGR